MELFLGARTSGPFKEDILHIQPKPLTAKPLFVATPEGSELSQEEAAGLLGRKSRKPAAPHYAVKSNPTVEEASSDPYETSRHPFVFTDIDANVAPAVPFDFGIIRFRIAKFLSGRQRVSFGKRADKSV